MMEWVYDLRKLARLTSWSATVANEWLTLLQGALGGGIIGAFVSPYVSQRSYRQTARANAREKLAEAEEARRGTDEKFSSAIMQFRTAAMIAGAPYSVVEKYISISREFRKRPEAKSSLDLKAPQKWSGFLNMDAVMTAQVLSTMLWHPWIGRMFVAFRLRLKLWIWRRRTMLMLVRSALIYYSDTGKIPLDDNRCTTSKLLLQASPASSP
jgi:hypothetical protein